MRLQSDVDYDIRLFASSTGDDSCNEAQVMVLTTHVNSWLALVDFEGQREFSLGSTNEPPDSFVKLNAGVSG